MAKKLIKMYFTIDGLAFSTFNEYTLYNKCKINTFIKVILWLYDDEEDDEED